MTGPEPAPTNPTPRETMLAQMLARVQEAIAAGIPMAEIERELAERYGEESAAVIDMLRAMQRPESNVPPKTPPPPPQVKVTGETWTMAGPITWTGPTFDNASSRFGRFELEDRIGAGGSGVVFRALDPQLGRLIALKIARAETLLSKEARQRFEREARLLAALRHPNIIPVYEAGEANGLPYIVQELCEGPTLAVWMRRRFESKQPVPIKVAAQWALLTARAVAQAHAVGIVHRDLKPCNILMENSAAGESKKDDADVPPENYQPRITDFGIAKLFGTEEPVTAPSTILGTAGYMAPEQAEGRTNEIAPPADVYSLGVILYELLSGRRPIEGVTDIDTLKRLATEEPLSLIQLRRDVPRDLDAICLKCLEKSPALRYESADALAKDLERFIADEPVDARPIGWIRRTGKAIRRQRRAVRVGAMSLLIAVLVGLLVFQRWPRSEAIEVDTAASYTSDVFAASNLWRENADRLRDNPQAGDEMAALLERHLPVPGQVDRRGFDWHYLWRLSHPAQAVGLLPNAGSLKGHTGDVYFVTFSRDGLRLASAGRDRTARVWDVVKQRRICVCQGHTDEVNWVEFSPDQTLLATASEDRTIKIWDANTGKERFTLTGHASEVVCVLFDATGKRLVSGDNNGVLKLWDLATRKQIHSVTAHSKRIQSIAWAAEGILASVGDDETVHFWGMPNLERHDNLRAEGAHSTAFNREGTMIAAGGGGTIRVLDVASRGPRASFSPHHSHIESVRFSPDGQQIASCGGDGVLYLWDLASRQGWMAAPCRFFDAEADSPVSVGLWCVAYSPDGRWLATSARDGLIEIYDATVTPQRTLVPNIGKHAAVSSLAFSRDGSRLAVARWALERNPGSFQIWDVSGRRPVLLADVNCTNAHSISFSPDQTQLAVGDEGKVDIVDAQTGRRQSQIELPPGYIAFVVHFAADGSLLVAKGHKSSMQVVLSVYDPKTGHEIRTLGEPYYPPHRLGTAFSERDGLVATLHPEHSGAISLYEWPSGRLRSNSLEHRSSNDHMAFSPVESLLAVAVEKGVELWNTTTCKEVAFLTGLATTTGPVAFTADGRLVLAVSPEQRLVHVWDVHELRELFTLPLPREQIFNANDWRLAVSPTGNRIAVSVTDDSRNHNIFLFGGLPATQTNSEATAEGREQDAPKP
jgi:eukaryotic-like serine/threonine-protein kinase